MLRRERRPWGTKALLAAGALIAATAGLLAPGCGDDDATAPADTTGTGDPVAVFLSHGNCKTAGAKAPAKGIAPDRDVLEYSFSGDTLRFRHVNTAFNCCIEAIDVSCDFAGDTIRVAELETLRNPGGCRCTCLYDMEWEIRGLPAAAYVIDVDQLYVGAESGRHRFAVDLAATPDGTDEIVRTSYPWDEPYAEPAIVLVSFTGCKVEPPAARAFGDSAAADCLLWSYEGSGALSLTHVNTAFNCCVDSLSVAVSVSGDTVRVTESEILDQGGCDCLCLYDLDCRVDHLPPGSYVLEIEQMYLGVEEDRHSYRLDLFEAVSDERCLTRSGYPWGQPAARAVRALLPRVPLPHYLSGEGDGSPSPVRLKSD